VRKGSAKFEAARDAGADIVVVGDLVVDGETVASTTADVESEKFTIAAGATLSMDASNDVVGTGRIDMLLPTNDLVPDSLFDPLMPVNTAELHLHTGYLIDGQPETIPAAVMAIDSLTFDDHADGIKASGDMFDRSMALKDSATTVGYEILAGANVYEEISARVARVYPNLQVVGPQTGVRLASLEVKAGESDLSVINVLAQSVGWSFYFDPTGTPILAQHAELGEPVETWAAGDGRILAVCRHLTRRNAHNAYMLTAESTRDTDAEGELPDPIIEIAFADHIDSPMYYDQAMFDRGEPGLFPLLYSTQALTDQAAVRLAARAGADRLVLQPESVSASVAPSPGLELFDTVSITNPLNKVFGLFTVGKIERPLGVGWYGFGTNERRLANNTPNRVTEIIDVGPVIARSALVARMLTSQSWFDMGRSITGQERIALNQGSGGPQELQIGSEDGATIFGGDLGAWFPGGFQGGSTNSLESDEDDGLAVTGTLRIEIDFIPYVQTGGNDNGSIICCYRGRMWDIGFTASGFLRFVANTNGTTGGRVFFVPTETIPDSQRIQLAVEHETGGVCTFYTRATDADPWVQLGDQLTDASSHPIYDSPSNHDVGISVGTISYHPLPCRVFSAKVICDGETQVDIDFTDIPFGSLSFTDKSDTFFELTAETDTNDPVLLPHNGDHYIYTNGGANYTRTPSPWDEALDEIEVMVRLQSGGGTTTEYPIGNFGQPGSWGVYKTNTRVGIIVRDDTNANQSSSAVHASWPSNQFIGDQPFWMRIQRIGGLWNLTFAPDTGDSSIEPTVWDDDTVLSLDDGIGGLMTAQRELRVGRGGNSFIGKFWRCIVRDGPGGTVLADMYPERDLDVSLDLDDGLDEWVSATGETWSHVRTTTAVSLNVVTEPRAVTDGTNGYVELGHTPDFTSDIGKFTALWVGRIEPHCDNYARLISFENGTNDGMALMIDDTGHFLGVIGDGTTLSAVSLNDPAIVRGKMASTRKTVATPTSDWYYTGDAAADHPAIGFRFWQGNADPNGNALFDVGFDPADVLIAHATSPE